MFGQNLIKKMLSCYLCTSLLIPLNIYARALAFTLFKIFQKTRVVRFYFNFDFLSVRLSATDRIGETEVEAWLILTHE